MYIKTRISIFMSLNYIATILFAFWAISPYFQRNTPVIAVLFIVALWIFSAFFEIFLKRKYVKGWGIIVCVLLWQLWEYSLRALGYSTASWGNYYLRTLFWFPIIIFLFQSIYATEKAKKKIAGSIFLIYVINLIDNLRLLSLYPNASGDINTQWGMQYIEMNVGSTMFSALTLLVFCISLAITLKHADKRVRILFGILCIIEFSYIYICARAISLILITIALILNIICIFPIYQKQKTLINFLIILVLPLIILLIPNLLELVIPYLNERIGERLADMINLFQGQSYEVGSSLYARINLALISLSTFFSTIVSFFIGVGYHVFQGIDVAVQNGVGGHSEFIDLLAKYGLVGAFFVLSILISTFKLIANVMKKETYYNNIKIVITIYIIYSFLNNSFSPEIGVVMFILLPYSKQLFGSKKEMKIKSCDERELTKVGGRINVIT